MLRRRPSSPRRRKRSRWPTCLPRPSDDAPSAPSATLDNPLRMADLAFQAGMLVEPEEYSAWTLYRGVVKAEPSNADAVQGLNKVADELVRRGETALEQGRFDDARAVVERIRAALPAHAGRKSTRREDLARRVRTRGRRRVLVQARIAGAGAAAESCARSNPSRRPPNRSSIRGRPESEVRGRDDGAAGC